LTDFGRIKATSAAYYEGTLAHFGDDPRGVNWKDAETQEIRFKVLKGIGDLSGKRIHDVGCGLAHFCNFLSENVPDCQYVGSDISQKMIEAAEARLGDTVELHVADILDDPPADWMEADYLVSSGLFAVRGRTSEEEWWKFVKTMAKRMFDLCRAGVAFNLMTSHVDYRENHLFYKHPGEALDFCISELGRKAVIRHDYPLWEYMVYVYK
jgi:SAM-dependent methyltransferase